MGTAHSGCKATEHAFEKFDVGTLFCKNCGETRSVQPHLHGGTYFVPYVVPYVPYVPVPRWVPDTPTWTVSGPGINGTQTISSTALAGFSIGDPTANA